MDAYQKIYTQILERHQCLSLKELAIDGQDLIAEAGMKPGREIGAKLHELLELVLDDPEKNTKQTLLACKTG